MTMRCNKQFIHRTFSKRLSIIFGYLNFYIFLNDDQLQMNNPPLLSFSNYEINHQHTQIKTASHSRNKHLIQCTLSKSSKTSIYTFFWMTINYGYTIHRYCRFLIIKSIINTPKPKQSHTLVISISPIAPFLNLQKSQLSHFSERQSTTDTRSTTAVVT